MKISAKDLISRGYFAAELPPAFTTISLGEKYATLFKDDSLDKISKGQKISECLYYEIPKSGFRRRVMGVPNPLFYIVLSKTLEDNSKQLQRYLNSKISSSLPRVDLKKRRALRTKRTNFSDFRKHCFLLSAATTYELKVDISRYYSTIYTHIIPWVLHGKAKAKKEKDDASLLGNILDRRVRSMQSNQTIGIPIGPDTSLLISELIGCKLDKELLKQFPELRVARYIDDYYLYFSSRSDAEKVLRYIQFLLASYSLDINEEKTAIKEFPFSTDPPWIISLRTLKTTCFDKTEKENQEDDIRQFFSAVFDWDRLYPLEGVIKFAAKTLQGVSIEVKNWEYFEGWIIKMGLYNPYTLPEICAILFENKDCVTKEKVEIFINELLNKHILKRHSFEIAWTLWLSKIFKIKLSSPHIDQIFRTGDSISILMGLDLLNKGLIKGSVKTSHLKSDLVKEALYDSRWLFAYESFLKGWLKPNKKNYDFIKKDQFFNKLLKNGISFYNDSMPEHKFAKKSVEEPEGSHELVSSSWLKGGYPG